MTTRSSIPKSDVPGVPIPWKKNSVVLNGETEYTTSTPISDAIADAVAGDTVSIGPGTYLENVVVDNDRMSILGAGPGTLIDGQDGGVAVDVTGVGVELGGFAAQTDAAGSSHAIRQANAGDSCNFHDLEVIEAGMDGIHLTGARGILSNFIVKGASNNGVECHDSANLISGGRIWGSTPAGLNGGGVDGAGMHVSADDTVVDHVSILGGGNLTTGVSFDAANAKLGLDNILVRSVTGNGLDLKGDDALVSSAIVVSASDRGVVLSGADPSLSNVATFSTTNAALDDSSATDPRYSNVWADGVLHENVVAVGALVKSPNGHIQNVVLDNGESAEISVPVPDGETLKVYRWGAYKVTDGTTPTDLDVELKDGSDTVQATENTGDNESTDPSSPVASHANSTGSSSIFKLAVANDTGATIGDPGVGAFFAYVVE